jgi:hypothetical protein
VSILAKLGWNDAKDGVAQIVVNFLLKAMEKVNNRTLGLSLINSLLLEFNSTKGSSLGVSLDFHQSCQIGFQKELLIRLFQMVVQAIHENVETGDEQILKLSITCAENILTWEFVNAGKLLQNKSEVYLDKNKALLKLSADWRPVLCYPGTVQLFFQLSQQYFRNPILSAKLGNCLIQLAGVHGPIFEDKNIHYQYIANFATSFNGYASMFR